MRAVQASDSKKEALLKHGFPLVSLVYSRGSLNSGFARCQMRPVTFQLALGQVLGNEGMRLGVSVRFLCLLRFGVMLPNWTLLVVSVKVCATKSTCPVSVARMIRRNKRVLGADVCF